MQQRERSHFLSLKLQRRPPAGLGWKEMTDALLLQKCNLRIDQTQLDQQSKELWWKIWNSMCLCMYTNTHRDICQCKHMPPPQPSLVCMVHLYTKFVLIHKCITGHFDYSLHEHSLYLFVYITILTSFYDVVIMLAISQSFLLAHFSHI